MSSFLRDYIKFECMYPVKKTYMAFIFHISYVKLKCRKVDIFNDIQFGVIIIYPLLPCIVPNEITFTTLALI